MKLAFILLLCLLCGCATQPKPSARTAAFLASVEMPLLPPDVPIAVVNEWPLPGLEIVTQAQRIAQDGSLHVALHDDKIMLWRLGADHRELALTNWLTRFGTAAVGIKGNVLVLAGVGGNFGPLIAQEYILTDWVNDFPTRAVFVTERPWSTWEGRDIRVVVTAAGGFFIATCRHTGGWQNDVLYRSPAGIWSGGYYEYVPNDFIPSFQLEVGQTDDGRIVILMNKDSAGKIMMARFIEQGGGIAFVDFNELLGPTDGQMTPDYEFPAMWSLNEDGRLWFSFKTAWDSKSGCYFRLAYPVLAELVVTPNVPSPRIVSWLVDQQNIWMTWESTEGQEYRPKASTDLAHWQTIQTWYSSTSKGQTTIGGNNPFYSVSAPLTNLFLTVQPVNYAPELFYLVPQYTERSWPPLKLLRRNGELSYLISPMDEPDCVAGQWFLSSDPNPLNFTIMMLGSDGWAVIRREDGYSLRRLI